MNKPIYQIAISGGIAVGKTTLTHKLSAKLDDCITFIEKPETNPFLADFYSDMKKWSFHSRIAMIALFAKRYKRIVENPKKHKISLMDRCIHELETFATLQYEKGNLSEREFKTFKEIYNAFVILSPPLNMVIFLKCSPEVALERIKLRGRKFELKVNSQYLNEVEKIYDDWILSLPSSVSVIQLNTDDNIDIDSLSKSILNKLFI